MKGMKLLPPLPLHRKQNLFLISPLVQKTYTKKGISKLLFAYVSQTHTLCAIAVSISIVLSPLLTDGRRNGD